MIIESIVIVLLAILLASVWVIACVGAQALDEIVGHLRRIADALEKKDGQPEKDGGGK